MDITSGADTTTDSLDFITTRSMIGGPGPSEQSGVDILTISLIIVASVMGTFVLITAVILIVIIRKNLCGCISHPDRYKHSHAGFHETESVGIYESALYSDLEDIPLEQSQHEIPVYEIIMTKSENSADVDQTNTCQVDLKDNVAYEATNNMTTQTNEAYGASTCPVDLKENIAYEATSNVTTQNNEAYGASMCQVDLKENIAYEISTTVSLIMAICMEHSYSDKHY